jgi:hypothetical protein
MMKRRIDSSTDNRKNVEKVSSKFYFLLAPFFLLYMVGGM